MAGNSNTNRPKKVWVIDASPGDLGPRMAVARQLSGYEVEIVPITKDLMTYLKRRYGVTRPEQAARYLPDIIIGGYIPDASFVSAARELSGDRTKSVALLVADKSYAEHPVTDLEAYPRTAHRHITRLQRTPQSRRRTARSRIPAPQSPRKAAPRRGKRSGHAGSRRGGPHPR